MYHSALTTTLPRAPLFITCSTKINRNYLLIKLVSYICCLSRSWGSLGSLYGRFGSRWEVTLSERAWGGWETKLLQVISTNYMSVQPYLDAACTLVLTGQGQTSRSERKRLNSLHKTIVNIYYISRFFILYNVLMFFFKWRFGDYTDSVFR
jgi:hypothetical protein